MTTQEIIEVIKGLSVLELNDLVKACEEEFGVSAAAGVVVAAAGGDAAGGAVEKAAHAGAQQGGDEAAVYGDGGGSVQHGEAPSVWCVLPGPGQPPTLGCPAPGTYDRGLHPAPGVGRGGGRKMR